MKRNIRIVGCVLLATALASPAWAGHGHGKGGPGGPSGPSGPSGATGPGDPESQAGGLPGLEDRVEGDEALIATLTTEVTTLQAQVGMLMSEVTTLQGQVATLNLEVGDLLGQNNWAVVTAAGTIARASSAAVTIADVHVAGSGIYEVNFGKDVSKCAYQATIGSTTAAPLPVLPQGLITVAGDADGDSPNDVFVQTSLVGGGPADFSFHLTVTCP
jgi:hypothetical protein